MSSIISALHLCRFCRRKGATCPIAETVDLFCWPCRCLTPTLYPAIHPAVRKYDISAPKLTSWHRIVWIFFNAGKLPSKIFHNLIIPFGFSPPLSDKCQPLYLGWPGLMSPAWAPTSTYPHNLLVNVADLFFYVTGTLLPSKRVN